MSGIRCGSDGGVSIGATHRCECLMTPCHEGRHGCHCGAMWTCWDCPEADPDGCAGCGAAGELALVPPTRPPSRPVSAEHKENEK